jgi:PAS domain S-box-containing protein
VVAAIITIWGFSFVNHWVKENSRRLFYFCAWLITFHYYYLFWGNGGDANWVVGSYITVMAIAICLLSSAALLAYSIFVSFLSVAMIFLLPNLEHSIFIPGIVTILLQANIGLRTRFAVIKNLANSNQRFQLLFNSTFEGVLVHENGVVTDANESLCKMCEYSRSELLGKSVLDILHPSERARVLEIMKLDEVTPYEAKGQTKSGMPLDVEIRAKNFSADGRIYRLVTVQDIGDRKRAEEERVRSLAMSENVKVRDEFISLASHELKTPLSALKLQSQLIQRDAGKDAGRTYTPSEVNGILGVLNRQVDRLNELVETMLDVSRISSGKLVLNLEEVDFSQLIRDVISTLQIPNIEFQGPLHVFIRADASRLKQIVENLVGNAIKYGERRPVMIGLETVGDKVLLKVKDQGIGIPDSAVKRIFERFERASSAKNIGGLGLGLYIVRQIAQAHGAEISVKSRVGEGSEFSLAFPLTAHL